MSNVIHVDFSPKKNESSTNDPKIEAYLNALRDLGIEEDDIFEINDAINNLEAFEQSDEDIQAFVTGYWSRQIEL